MVNKPNPELGAQGVNGSISNQDPSRVTASNNSMNMKITNSMQDGPNNLKDSGDVSGNFNQKKRNGLVIDQNLISLMYDKQLIDLALLD